MTVTDAEEFLARHRKTPIDSAELVGFELISADIVSHDLHGRIAIVHMIMDCNGSLSGRPIPYHLAIAPNGALTLWALPPEPPTP